MSVESEVPGYDYRAFGTIKEIKGNAKMKGVHCSLGMSNCICDLLGLYGKGNFERQTEDASRNFTLDGLTGLC